MHFPKLEEKHEAARKAITDAINREFPVGSIVTCLSGRGRQFCKVHDLAWSHDVYLQNISSGRYLSRHYSQVEHAERR